MKLNYRKSSSTIRPELLDTTSSRTTVYIRRNIEEEVRTDPMSETTCTYYNYEEATMTKNEYKDYQIQQQRADIDYISIMTGVDLEVETDE